MSCRIKHKAYQQCHLLAWTSINGRQRFQRALNILDSYLKVQHHKQDILTQQPEPDTYGLRGSQRAALPPQRLIEGLEAQVRQESTTHVAYETLYKPDMGTELEDQDPLLAFAASADPDTMDLHQAMKQPDKDQLKQAVKEEPLFYLQCDR